MKPLNFLQRAACLTLLLSAPALADTAYEFTSASSTTDAQLSLGFDFTTIDSITVTSLGYYDNGGDGLLTQHEVGIYDSLGDLIADATVAAGTVDPLTGNFRYVSITPVVLAAGQTYTIAATTYGTSSDPWMYGVAGSTIVGFTEDSAISIPTTGALYNYQTDNILRDPTSVSGNTVYGGPDFMFTDNSGAGTPEPQTFGLALAGLGAIVAFKRRRAV
jgi:hypothetical protein